MFAHPSLAAVGPVTVQCQSLSDLGVLPLDGICATAAWPNPLGPVEPGMARLKQSNSRYVEADDGGV